MLKGKVLHLRTKLIESTGKYLIDFIAEEIKKDNALVDSITGQYYIHFIKSEIALDKTNNSNISPNLAKIYNYRDTIMSENLTFLLRNVFKNKKAIISTATSHITKKIEQLYENETINGYQNMICHLDKEILEKSYMVAFIPYQGETGRPGTFFSGSEIKKIKSQPITSIEYFLSEKYNYCFLDCNKNKGYQTFLESKTISPIVENSFNVKWFDMYDGLFFIKNMKPVKLISILNRWGRHTLYKVN